MGGPEDVDVWSDDAVTLSTEYSTQRESLADVGAESTWTGTGSRRPSTTTATALASTSWGRSPTPAAMVGSIARRRRPRPRAHGVPRHAGPRHPRDLVERLGREWRGVDLATLQEIMAADGVVVEPGDMLLWHTGYATDLLEWNRNPDPEQLFRMRTWLDARDEASLEWIADRQIAALIADNDSVEGSSARTGTRPATRPADRRPAPLQAWGPARRAVVPPPAVGMAARA